MSHRPAMLATEVRSVIAPVLRRCPPACGIVSIARIDISTDSSYATVYITALEHADEALQFLRDEARELQRQLGKLPRRKIPLLRFRLDRGAEEGARIDKLLGEASKGMQGDS
jgi:ribosome-binding factor A